MKVTADSTTTKQKLARVGAGLRHYIVVIFLLFLLGIYGFLAWRVFTLTSAEPTADEVSAPLKTVNVTPVKQENIQKIEQLQDNSVSVHALFDEARQNPFQE